MWLQLVHFAKSRYFFFISQNPDFINVVENVDFAKSRFFYFVESRFFFISQNPYLQSAFYTSKGNTCKALPFSDFWIKFGISSVAPTQSSTSYAYLITKVGNRDFKDEIRVHTYISYFGKFFVKIMLTQPLQGYFQSCIWFH